MSRKPLVVAFISDVAGAIRSAKQYAAEITGIGNASDRVNEKTEETGEAAKQASKVAREAMKNLGVVTEDLADKRIASLKKSFEDLKASGKATPDEIARAFKSMETRIAAVNKSIDRDTRSTFEKIKEGAGKLGQGFGRVGGIAAAGAAVGAGVVGAATAGAVALGQEGRLIDRAATAAGLDTNNNADLLALQRFAFASDARFGVPIDELGDILKDTNDRLGDFVNVGGGPLADFAQRFGPQLGITLDKFLPKPTKDKDGKEIPLTAEQEEEANKRFRQAIVGTFQGENSIETLQNFFKKLEELGVRDEESLTFFAEAMASNVTLLTGLFSNGGAELKRLGDVGESTGGFVDAEDLARLRTFNEDISKLTLSMRGLQLAIAEAGVLDLIRGLVETVTGVVNWMRENAPFLLDFGVILGVIAAVLAPIALVGAAMAIAFGGLAAPIAGVIAGIAAVGAILYTFWDSIEWLWEKVKSILPEWLVGEAAPSDTAAAARAAAANAAPPAAAGTPVNLTIENKTYPMAASADVAAALAANQNAKTAVRPTNPSRALK
jgi:hypothetical protein